LVGSLRAQFIIDDIPDLQESSEAYGKMKGLASVADTFDDELTSLEKILKADLETLSTNWTSGLEEGWTDYIIKASEED